MTAMAKGKDICKTLKRIRQEVADANGISYRPKECHHTGPCRGTCPACEAEVRYLEQQLSLRQRLGKAVAVAGVALSALNMHAQGTEAATLPTSTCGPEDVNSTLQKEVPVKSMLMAGERGVIWRGQVVDKEGEPCIGVTIVRTDIPKNRDMSTISDIDGRFAVEIPVGAELTFYYVGMISVAKTVANENPAQVTMEDDDNLMGEVVIAGGVDRISYDDVYGRCRKK